MNSTMLALATIVGSDAVEPSDAIIVLEGDGYSRVESAARLFKEGLAPVILISGGIADRPPFTIPAPMLAERIFRAGVPRRSVVVEAVSRNTREQSIAVMAYAKEKKWKRIILVASFFHQLRAYLTFLQAMKEARLKIRIFNAPVHGLPWFRKTSLRKDRLQLLEEEREKISLYRKKGHLASFRHAIWYERWKERQHL